MVGEGKEGRLFTVLGTKSSGFRVFGVQGFNAFTEISGIKSLRSKVLGFNWDFRGLGLGFSGVGFAI